LKFCFPALNISGGYFSPVYALVGQFGCVGATPWDEFIVYWLAPAIGYISASGLASVLILR